MAYLIGRHIHEPPSDLRQACVRLLPSEIRVTGPKFHYERSRYTDAPSNSSTAACVVSSVSNSWIQQQCGSQIGCGVTFALFRLRHCFEIIDRDWQRVSNIWSTTRI